MTLEELITALEAADARKICPHGFANPHSYRGYYDQVAFEPASNVSVGAMLAAARSALGATYTGYKGGEYTMTEHTDCHLAFWGHVGEEIGPTLLQLMLAAAVDPPSLRDQVREALTRELPCPSCGKTEPCRCHTAPSVRVEARVDALMAVIEPQEGV